MFYLDSMDDLADRSALDRDDARQAQDARDDRRALRSLPGFNVPASGVRSSGSKVARATGSL